MPSAFDHSHLSSARINAVDFIERVCIYERAGQGGGKDTGGTDGDREQWRVSATSPLSCPSFSGMFDIYLWQACKDVYPFVKHKQKNIKSFFIHIQISTVI